MVKYLGFCRPLGKKVEFTVKEVNELDTTKGKKWLIQGIYEKYNISTFSSESSALEVQSQLEDPSKVFDAEISHISKEDVYEMEELLPFAPNWKAEEEPEEDTVAPQESVTSGGARVDDEDDQGLLDPIPSAEDDMIKQGIEGREKMKGRALSDDVQYEGIPKKYLKKDGTPDMRYKICKEWGVGREVAEEKEEDSPSISEAKIEEEVVDRGRDEEIIERVSEQVRMLNPNTLTIPKSVYYELMDFIPDTVTAEDTLDGTSVTLGFWSSIHLS